jgi:hypothetical protein
MLVSTSQQRTSCARSGPMKGQPVIHHQMMVYQSVHHQMMVDKPVHHQMMVDKPVHHHHLVYQQGDASTFAIGIMERKCVSGNADLLKT